MPEYGPTNVIIGDDTNYGMDLPARQTAGADAELNEAGKMARFSKSAEFKALKEKLESRIDYYRSYQPASTGGDLVMRDLPNDERGWRWLASDLIISEFQAVISAYELAAEQVKNETTKQKAA